MSWLRTLIEQAVNDQREHNNRIERRLGDFQRQLNRIEEIDMADQDTINAIAANVDQINTTVQAITVSATDVEAELAKLLAAQGSGQPLDFSALQASVASLQTNIGNVNTLLPDPGPQGTGAAKAQ